MAISAIKEESVLNSGYNGGRCTGEKPTSCLAITVNKYIQNPYGLKVLYAFCY
jgi:hypothetical protein